MKKIFLTILLIAPTAFTLAKKGDQDFLKAVASGNIKKAKIALEYGAYINAMDKDGYTALHLAIKKPYYHADPHLLKLLLDKGADIDELTNNAREGCYPLYCDRTALDIAVQNDDLLATFLLLTYGAEDSSALKNGNSEINALLTLIEKYSYKFEHWEFESYYGPTYAPETYDSASDKDLTNVLENLLGQLQEADLNIDIPNSHGETLLHFAVKNGDSKVIQDLLKAGANVNAQDDRGKTPLHYTVKWAPTMNSQLVKILLEHGASVTIEDATGKTPLMKTCHILTLLANPRKFTDSNFFETDETHRAHKEIINLLLAHGASADEHSTKNNRSPLDILLDIWYVPCNGKDLKKAYAECLKRVLSIAKLLIKNGASVNTNTRNDEGNTLLHEAASPELAALFISQGADVHATNNKGQTPLYTLGQAPFYMLPHESVALLVRHGAEIDAADNEGNTLLFRAKEAHDIIFLVKHGANVHHKNYDGETALHHVKNKECAQALLDHGANLYELDNEGNTALHHALDGYKEKYYECPDSDWEDCNSFSLVPFLINAGCSINQQNAQGKTPLNRLDNEGNTVLHSAIDAYLSSGATEILKHIQFLIDSGSPINQQNAQGKTPLHIASSNPWGMCDLELVRILLDNGADPFIKDNNGDTPLQIVHHEDDYDQKEEAINLLKESMASFNKRSN